jgi:hypothetical protein
MLSRLSEVLFDTDERWATVDQYMLKNLGRWITSQEVCALLRMSPDELSTLQDLIPIYATGIPGADDAPINWRIACAPLPEASLAGIKPSLGWNSDSELSALEAPYQKPENWRFRERDLQIALLLKFPLEPHPLDFFWTNAKRLIHRWNATEEKLNLIKNNEYSGLPCYTLDKRLGFMKCEPAQERLDTDLYGCLFPMPQIWKYEMSHLEDLKINSQRLDELHARDLARLIACAKPNSFRPKQIAESLQGTNPWKNGPHSDKLVRGWFRDVPDIIRKGGAPSKDSQP